MPSVPRFSNPHIHKLIDCELSSRAKIFDHIDSEEDDDQETQAKPRSSSISAHSIEKDLSSGEPSSKKRRQAEKLSWLDDYLRASLMHNISEGKLTGIPEADNTSSKQSKKRNRGKVGKEGSVEEASIPDDGAVHSESSIFDFQLLSYPSGATRRIDIRPKPPKPSRVVEREYEDTPEAAAIRFSRAQEAAVDFSWISAQSNIVYPIRPTSRTQNNVYMIASSSYSSIGKTSGTNDNHGAISTQFTPSSQLPTLLVTEAQTQRKRTKTKPTAPIATTSSTNTLLPSPHELKEGKKMCCPVVPVLSVPLQLNRTTPPSRAAPHPEAVNKDRSDLVEGNMVTPNAKRKKRRLRAPRKRITRAATFV